MAHNHDHDHDHDHEEKGIALRVKALEQLLIEKGVVNAEALDEFVDIYENRVGPKNGAKVVARAWVDDAYKQRLLADGAAAAGEFGFTGFEGEYLKVVENSDDVHNVVVCTLCSCYPFSILGIAPAWYKAAAYRSRAVRDPRGVLREFGVNIDDDVEVRVWDSTAELRYLVLPQRPPATQDMSENELLELVTRNSIIGTDRDLGGQQ